MCGIFGVTNIDHAVEEIYAGLIAQQHRGQDACGIHTWARKFNVKKGFGLVMDTIGVSHLKRLKGRSGIGHVRYATVGAGEADDIQPFFESEYFRASMAHNGNLTNFSELRDMFGSFATTCDLEGILKVLHTSTLSSSIRNRLIDEAARFTEAITGEQLKKALDNFELPVNVDMSSDAAIDFIIDGVRKVMQRCEGSYSAIGNIPGLGLIGFKDPHGIKPLVFGVKPTDDGVAYAFASEDVAFQPGDYDVFGEVEPGSLVIARPGHTPIIQSILPAAEHTPCIFEWIYFASPCSEINRVSVSEYRYQLGKINGLEYMEHFKGRWDPDKTICSHIPSAAKRGADGFCVATGIDSRDVFIRNNYMKRGFILPNRAEREYNAKLKLPIDPSVLREAETLILVDDSIVRGDTSKNLMDRLRNMAEKRGFPLKHIHFISLAPPNVHPCVYGIDMAVDKELIAKKLGGVEGVRQYIGADYLQYQELHTLGRVLSKLRGQENSTYCDACFSGRYPTGITSAQIDNIKRERLDSKGSDY